MIAIILAAWIACSIACGAGFAMGRALGRGREQEGYDRGWIECSEAHAQTRRVGLSHTDDARRIH
jgi:membrane protein DedA with SNARE-associated domain